MDSGQANYSPGQGICNGMERSGKAGRGKRSLVSAFPCFVSAIAEFCCCEGGRGAEICVHPNLRFL